MRLVPFYLLHTFKNAIKKIFKTWVAIMLVCIVLFGVIGGVVGAVLGNTLGDTESESSEAEVDTAPTPEDILHTGEIIELVAGGGVLLILLLNLYGSDKSGAQIFSMADVNFLFTSPMKPQSVLIFRVIMQMGITAAGFIYLFFQIPNLMRTGMSFFSALTVIAAWILTFIAGKLISVLTYELGSLSERFKKLIRPLTLCIAALFVLLYCLGILSGGGYYDTAVSLFASRASRFVPIWGWLKGIVAFAYEGDALNTAVCFAAVIASCVLIAFISVRIKVDFYEDALSGAEKLQTAQEAAASGIQESKKRSDKLKRGEIGHGSGAAMFFIKEQYNRRRFLKLGAVSSTGILYFLLCIAGALVMRLVIKTDNINVAGMILLVIVFFRNLGNPLGTELSKPFLYLVPESPYMKLFYAVSFGTYNTALDVVPPFIILGAVIGAPALSVALWIVLFISADFFASCTGLFVELLIPESVVPVVKAILQMLLKMLLGAVCFVLIIIGTFGEKQLLFYLIVSAVNIFGGGLLFAFCPEMLHSGNR